MSSLYNEKIFNWYHFHCCMKLIRYKTQYKKKALEKINKK